MFSLERDNDTDIPSEMVWSGTGESAREMVDWARDEALICFAAATPPTYGAPADSPAASWRLQLRLPVRAELGGGDTWVPVPVGSTIRNTGTWVDPRFEILPPEQKAAEVFAEPPKE